MPERKEYVIIDSRRRDTGSTSSSDFTYTFKRIFHNVTGIQLVFANFPYVLYNITSSNNSVTFNNGSNRTATLTAGLYTATALATELGTQMTTSGGGDVYTATFSTTTFKFTIASAGAAFFMRMATGSTPYLELGFSNTVIDSGTGRTSSTATSLTADNAASLERPTLVNISLDRFDMPVLLAAPSSTQKNSYQSTFVVPLEDGNGALNTFLPFCSSNTRMLTETVQFDQLKVQLTDVDGTVLSMNGLDWALYAYFIEKDDIDNCPCCSSGGCGDSKKRKTCH